jgi:Domain of unknown function (DUF4432)
MPALFGQKISRTELFRKVGDLSQVAGIRMMTLREGFESGVRIADVRTGSGLRFQVTLDRGMDISVAEFRGIPLAWRSANGDVHPSFYDARGLGWQRSFPGGLMTGCGVTHLGAPCIDEGEELGLHGRLSNTPAFNVHASSRWEGEECTCTLEGFIGETSPPRVQMMVHRTFHFRLGESRVRLRDVVKNESTQSSPLMMLYHFNPGWPLIDNGVRLMLNAKETQPRDPEARLGLEEARAFTEPVPQFHEQVFYHDLQPDAGGNAHAFIQNERLGLGFFVSFRKKELPRYIEWKMMGEGLYVVGMEPANCRVWGRAKEREAGTLQFLEPGEERTFELEFGVVEGTNDHGQFIRMNNLT